MGTTATILVLWLAFAATHMGFSSQRLRPSLVSRLGERAFLGLYSLVSLALFVPLVAVFSRNKHSGPLLWDLGGIPGMQVVVYLGMALVFALVVGGIARPSPASLRGGKAEVVGVFRITRHPLFMGLGLYGLLHLLAGPVNASELVFFGGFPIFSVAACRHQDQRKLASLGDEFRRFHAATPFLPAYRGLLPAVVETPVPIAIGVGLMVVIRYFHGTLFG